MPADPSAARSRYDVNADGYIAPNDVLIIIDYINAYGAGPLRPNQVQVSPYYDVDGDGFVAAADPLWIINVINGGGPVEGERQPSEM